MSFFRKLGKGLKKLAKSKLVRAGIGTAIGGPVGGLLAGKVGQKVLSTAKTIGRAARGRVIKPLDQVRLIPQVEAVRMATSPRIRPPRAEVMRELRRPGRRPSRSPTNSSAASKNGAKRRASTSSRAASPAKAKRRPPPGGKDFKALSASWRQAGKPGTWLEWVKTH